MKIARVATVPFFLYNHLRGQIAATVGAGHEVVLVSSGGREVPWLKEMPGIRFVQIEIPRKISPRQDLKALWQLYWLFRRERFDIVHSGTPKAGMLCAIAGYLARVPVRLHTFTGQAWVELHGIVRALAKAGDRLTARLDTRCYADALSQREFIVEQAVAAKEKINVVGAGSLAGVDLARFSPGGRERMNEALLRELNIPAGHKIVTFIGRITRDKGIYELIESFRALVGKGVPCSLLLVGPEESAPGERISHALAGLPNVHVFGYQPDPERWLAITDVFCLPSYREGFGNVVVEAAAMGVPTVGTDIVGLRDTIVAGETGLLVPPKDVHALTVALTDLLGDDEKRRRMGQNARIRAVDLFDSRKVNAGVLDEYQTLWSLP
ncbi:MAG: glycosyltransferase family 4 protein [Betaproteobacteria bacterium]|nr:glycosyltransferase family 4 protein [Betaproteobacteria bacterium]